MVTTVTMIVSLTHSGCRARGSTEDRPGPWPQVTPEMTGTGLMSLRLHTTWEYLPFHSRQASEPAQPGAWAPACKQGLRAWQARRHESRARNPGQQGLIGPRPQGHLPMHRIMSLTVTSNEYYGKWPPVLRSTYKEKNQNNNPPPKKKQKTKNFKVPLYCIYCTTNKTFCVKL